MIEVREAPTPIETVTPIKVSEAIRLGCLVRPIQSFIGFGRESSDSACVIGAADVGYGFSPGDGESLSMIPFEVKDARCPEPTCHSTVEQRLEARATYASLPFHLNDDHRWSRERIADWLESVGQ